MPKSSNTVVRFEPRLVGSALSYARSFTGHKFALLNAGRGSNAELLDAGDLVESQPEGVAYLRAKKVTAGLSDFSHIFHAPATATGLPDGAYASLIVDHAELETDITALINEARRLASREVGCRLLLIGYGMPWIGDPNLHLIITDFWKKMMGAAQGLEAAVRSDFKKIDLPLIDSPRPPGRGFAVAEAQMNVHDLIKFFERRPSVKAIETGSFGCSFVEFKNLLGQYWGGARERRPVRFMVGMRGGVLDVEGVWPYHEPLPAERAFRRAMRTPAEISADEGPPAEFGRPDRAEDDELEFLGAPVDLSAAGIKS
jgi:hypothetical protein